MSQSKNPYSRRMKVPALPEGLTWVNTDRPLKLEELKGKFVLIDFWTYCCINCMHILPELKKLEHAYPNELVVIGVHSPKFDTEEDTENLTEAVLRYKIEHPVVNDTGHVIWNRFGVRAWPTLLLIDPEGFAVWGKSGEATFEQIDEAIKLGLPYYDRRKLLDRTPLRLVREKAPETDSPLRFPGKVLADEASGRLFIADTNHNRLVVTDLDGKLLEVVGSGATGRDDGDFDTARFNQPQGMAIDGQVLYVADTENHLLRKVDFATRTVSTVAGLGHQSREPAKPGRLAPRLKTALNSPWALWIAQRNLYIAMAGWHQIWWMPLDGSGIGPYAGNGAEDIVDGVLLPQYAYQQGFSSFAQPSGLTSDGTWLYVADSEGSSIRAVPLDRKKAVETVVGTAHLSQNRLFTFGDVDGSGLAVRLQHPLGVAYHKGKLYVADTYNNKIKMIDPKRRSTTTVAGSGEAGESDEPAQFDEPAGIAATAGRLYVADTNNHRIRVVDLSDGYKVSTLTITGLTPPAPGP